MSKKIFVTQPSLPPLEEYIPYLEKIWESKWLTNDAQFHKQFEKALGEYLGVKHCCLFTNGTLALIIALQALRITGEVITTPFSFVATTHSLHWNGIKPVFCDIREEDFNLDPGKIEALITPRTTAILPVHIYGSPCNMERIEEIADIYGLRVIYDAAHAFGVTQNDRSILNAGDMSILSFHATKVFTTFEGGAITCNDDKLKKRIDYLRNFGFAGEITVVGPGINAKMSEFQAALGLVQLKRVHKDIAMRKEISMNYRRELQGIAGIKVFDDLPGVSHNYSYFPILVDRLQYGKSRDELYEILKMKDIFTRRYFYPLISHFPTYRSLDSAQPGNLPVAEKLSKQVLCLPLFPALSQQDLERIVGIIKDNGG